MFKSSCTRQYISPPFRVVLYCTLIIYQTAIVQGPVLSGGNLARSHLSKISISVWIQRVNCQPKTSATKTQPYSHWSRWRCRNAPPQHWHLLPHVSSALCQLRKRDPKEPDKQKQEKYLISLALLFLTDWLLSLFSHMYCIWENKYTHKSHYKQDVQHQAAPELHICWHNLPSVMP